MRLIQTKFDGCFLIENDLYDDHRGLFFEAFNEKNFMELSGLKIDFLQDNISVSKKNVLRGLHYQEAPYQQSKLVTVLSGEVLDVVVDLRKDSTTYGEHLKFNIMANTGKSLFIPKGMAHGFLALSDKTLFSYKCDEYYNPNYERGIHFDDPGLNIDWDLNKNEIILSEKDKNLPFLNTRNK